MTNEKFAGEVETLKKFFTIYCSNKHTDQHKFTKKLQYRYIDYDIELELCDECKELIEYSFLKLQECPHDIKPRCRQCPNPCYEKQQWKSLAKLMRYSGMQLGLTKIKSFLKF